MYAACRVRVICACMHDTHIVSMTKRLLSPWLAIVIARWIATATNNASWKRYQYIQEQDQIMESLLLFQTLQNSSACVSWRKRQVLLLKWRRIEWKGGGERARSFQGKNMWIHCAINYLIAPQSKWVPARYRVKVHYITHHFATSDIGYQRTSDQAESRQEGKTNVFVTF